MNKISVFLFFISVAVCGFKCNAQTVSGNVAGYDYVDLGLSSGRLWATCNVGASASTEYGDLFAWGETEPKTNYSYKTYKWASSERSYKKYCTDSYYGTVDYLYVLVADDDAATANWGIDWRMPTTEEQGELVDGCTWESVKNYNDSGIDGHLGTSKTNGNTIFFPYTGTGAGGALKDYTFGCYWSSSVYRNNSDRAKNIEFTEKSVSKGTVNVRTKGESVRAVVSGKVVGTELVANQEQMFCCVNDGILQIDNAIAQNKVQVFDVNGKVVATTVIDANGQAEIALPSINDVYVVTVGNQSMKVVVK